MKKIIIFASGSGSNAENIIGYFSTSMLAKVVGVFTNNPNAYVIERSKRLGVNISVFSKDDLETNFLLDQVNNIKPDLIVLAGFLLKFPKSIIDCYPSSIINIHPALLPKFGGKGMYGMNVHKAVVESRESETGITIHFVNEHYDQGSIIFQAKVAVLVQDTCQVVAEKVHDLECRYFPKVIEDLLSSRV